MRERRGLSEGFKRLVLLEHLAVLKMFTLYLLSLLSQANYMYNKLSKKAGARITIHDP